MDMSTEQQISTTHKETLPVQPNNMLAKDEEQTIIDKQTLTSEKPQHTSQQQCEKELPAAEKQEFAEPLAPDNTGYGNKGQFKKVKKKRSLRVKRDEEEDECTPEDNAPSHDGDQTGEMEDDVLSKLSDVKELQKLRQRPKGVNAVSLAIGKNITRSVQITDDPDPFKLKTGGIIDKRHIDMAVKSNATEDDMINLGATFSAETNKRDEDLEMLKYVDEQLKAAKGLLTNEDEYDNKDAAAAAALVQDPVLQSIPDKYRAPLSTKSEETLSHQMLSGIPEVDLGIHAKIENIVQTEQAKEKFVDRQRQMRLDAASGGTDQTKFVPVNMAVNFVQHSRWKSFDDTRVIHQHYHRHKQEQSGSGAGRGRGADGGPEVGERLATELVVGGLEKHDALKNADEQKQQRSRKRRDRSDGKNYATDDVLYERYKKQVLKRF